MVTSIMILLAVFNGCLIVTTRVVNARLGLHISGAGAAVWNHLVGFLFLALFVPFFLGKAAFDIGSIPVYLFLGGIIGSGYVAINNWVVPKVGATKATVFLIAGQIVIGTIIDLANGQVSNLHMTIIGISLIVLGMWFGSDSKMTTSKAHNPLKNCLEDSA